MELNEVVKAATLVLSDAEKMIAEQLRALSTAVREANESAPTPAETVVQAWRVRIDSMAATAGDWAYKDKTKASNVLYYAAWMLAGEWEHAPLYVRAETLAKICALAEIAVHEDFNMPLWQVSAVRVLEDEIKPWTLLQCFCAYGYNGAADKPLASDWKYLGDVAAQWLREIERDRNG